MRKAYGVWITLRRENFFGSFEDEWMQVFSEPPAQRIRDLIKRPRPFIAAHTPHYLEKLLPDAHLGEALVSIGLTRAADAAKLGDLCPPLMDGLFPGGPAGKLVRGRLLVTDHGRVLREASATPNDRNSWLARLIWLVEGGAGPEPPSTPDATREVIRLPDVTGRFEVAIHRIRANRLNTYEPQPAIYTDDISIQQTRWMEFLHGMEETLPGIRGTARSLFPSLTFGLYQLAGTTDLPKGFKLQIQGIEAFARFLIRRMANARNEML